MRRDILKFTATAIVCGIVAGVGGYFSGIATAPPKTVTETIPGPTTTVTKTVPVVEKPPSEILMGYDFAACSVYQFVAIREGFFDRVGLGNVKWGILPCMSVAEFREVLHTGKAPICGEIAYEFLPVVDEGGDFIYLNGMHMGCIEAMVTDELYAAGVKDETSFIEWVKEGKEKGELRQINVSHFGNTPYWWLGIILDMHGLSIEKDVKITVTEMAAVPAAMEAGKIQCAFEWDPIPRVVEREGIGRIIIDQAIHPPWNELYCCFVGVQKSFFKKYPETTKKATMALAEAAKWVEENPRKAAKSFMKFGKELCPYEEDELTLMFEVYDFGRPSDPEMEVRTLKTYGDFMHKAGFLRHDGSWIVKHGWQHIWFD